MALKFDKTGLINEILDKLEIELKDAFKMWEAETISKMRNTDFKKNADFEIEMKKETNIIIAYLRANPVVIADSYGTGSLMLDNNPNFEEYRNDKSRWNPSRTGKPIVGRPEGEYVDIFGNKKYSKGYLEGENIEGWELVAGSGYKIKIEPVAPSYALQDAFTFLYNTYLPRAYKLAIQNINFAKYLKES